jgi:hypothetical protein
MMYKITMVGSDYTGKCYGMTWVNGETHTDDKFTADRLKAKGFVVTEDKPARSKEK